MEDKTSVYKILGWVILGIVIVVFLVWVVTLGAKEQNTPDTTLITVASDDYISGPQDAPVTLIEYLDFECEGCRSYFATVKQLEKDFPNDLRVVRRYYPLPGHKNGLPAALAVEAAARQGKYNEMHDLLFQEQQNWGEKQNPTPEIFKGYAQQIGLDLVQFKEDVASASVKDRVQRDVTSGSKLGITGTPTFLINGKKISNPRSYDNFRSLIQTTLSENK